MYLILAGLAILQSLVALLQTWEHRRFARSQFRALSSGSRAKTMVFAPCKGIDVELQETLERLLDQDYPDYDVTFIVDSVSDPAYWLIRRMMVQHPTVATHLVIAGLAHDCGQKVHNLRVATAEIPVEVQYLAFIDSDAKPRREWLRALVSHLEWPGVGAASGYRWFVPVERTLASWLIYSINCGAAVMMRSRGPNLVWGGSWAVRRDVFEILQLREAWEGVLTEDLVVAEQVQRHGLHVRFEPMCMVASPLEGSRSALFSFLRRQYVLGRCYAPRWWRIGGASMLVGNLAWAASLGLLAWGLAASPASAWMAGSVSAAMYALLVLRGFARRSLVRLYCPEHADALRQPGWFDVWAAPLVSAVSLAVLLRSAMGRTMTWRGITYSFLPDGRARILERDAEPGDRACGDDELPEDSAGSGTGTTPDGCVFSAHLHRRRTA